MSKATSGFVLGSGYPCDYKACTFHGSAIIGMNQCWQNNQKLILLLLSSSKSLFCHLVCIFSCGWLYTHYIYVYIRWSDDCWKELKSYSNDIHIYLWKYLSQSPLYTYAYASVHLASYRILLMISAIYIFKTADEISTTNMNIAAFRESNFPRCHGFY